MLGRQQPRIASLMAKLRALVSKFACKKIHLHDGFFYYSYEENFFFMNFYLHKTVISILNMIHQ